MTIDRETVKGRVGANVEQWTGVRIDGKPIPRRKDAICLVLDGVALAVVGVALYSNPAYWLGWLLITLTVFFTVRDVLAFTNKETK